MNIKDELEKIWSQDYINELPLFIKERGYVFSINDIQRDFLITGINPSFREGEQKISFGFDFQETLRKAEWDNYWGSLKKMVYDQNNFDLRERTAYLDIFYFREKNQKILKDEILKRNCGISFIIDQLRVTQKTIEEIIQPKVIIVKNKESAAYWGKYADKGLIWMGYQLEKIELFECGELYKINGFIDSPERINKEFSETKLKNSLILFSQHINQYTKREKRPTAIFINGLLENYYQK
jgi:hypothetical protein